MREPDLEKFSIKLEKVSNFNSYLKGNIFFFTKLKGKKTSTKLKGEVTEITALLAKGRCAIDCEESARLQQQEKDNFFS